MFVGVDGCRGGWIAVAITGDGFRYARHTTTFAALMHELDDAVAIGVDMPLGLVAKGHRDAERAARAFLVGQASSVFNSPPRSALRAATYDEAQRLTRKATGKGLSKQSYHLLAKIIEVDAFIGEPRLSEVHPEVSFRIMNRAERVPTKTSWAGLTTRLRLLRREGIKLPDDLGEAGRVGIDDLVDAAGAAWSARRIAKGDDRSFPGAPTQTDRGRALAIRG